MPETEAGATPRSFASSRRRNARHPRVRDGRSPRDTPRSTRRNACDPPYRNLVTFATPGSKNSRPAAAESSRRERRLPSEIPRRSSRRSRWRRSERARPLAEPGPAGECGIRSSSVVENRARGRPRPRCKRTPRRVELGDRMRCDPAATAPVRRFDVGHSLERRCGVRNEKRRRRPRSSSARTPWPMRSAPRIVDGIADGVDAPAASPACATACRPCARAKSNGSAIERGREVGFVAPEPDADDPAGRPRRARRPTRAVVERALDAEVARQIANEGDGRRRAGRASVVERRHAIAATVSHRRRAP